MHNAKKLVPGQRIKLKKYHRDFEDDLYGTNLDMKKYFGEFVTVRTVFDNGLGFRIVEDRFTSGRIGGWSWNTKWVDKVGISSESFIESRGE